jgi:pimeloyl-ACP methyl ester carboxylesterase
MSHTTIRAHGLDLHCLTWGDEAAPLVLLVHGFPDTAHTWDVVGPRVADAGFRVVAPNTRGIHPSAIPADGDYGSDTLAGDLLAIADALGRDQVILVGHDFGASAVYSAAGLFPDRVRKLVAMAIPHPATVKPTPRFLWGARHFLANRMPWAAAKLRRNDFAQIREFYERWSPDFDWPESAFAETKESYRHPGVAEAALAYYRFIGPKIPVGQRTKLAMPTLIVGGLTDGVCIEEDFEKSRRRFTVPIDVAMVPGGHFFHNEHPEPFIDVLLPFLTRGTEEPGAGRS